MTLARSQIPMLYWANWNYRTHLSCQYNMCWKMPSSKEPNSICCWPCNNGCHLCGRVCHLLNGRTYADILLCFFCNFAKSNRQLRIGRYLALFHWPWWRCSYWRHKNGHPLRMIWLDRARRIRLSVMPSSLLWASWLTNSHSWGITTKNQMFFPSCRQNTRALWFCVWWSLKPVGPTNYKHTCSSQVYKLLKNTYCCCLKTVFCHNKAPRVS